MAARRSTATAALHQTLAVSSTLPSGKLQIAGASCLGPPASALLIVQCPRSPNAPHISLEIGERERYGQSGSGGASVREQRVSQHECNETEVCAAQLALDIRQ